MNTGWLCPRCNVVHAPSVLRCECKAQKDPKEAARFGDLLDKLRGTFGIPDPRAPQPCFPDIPRPTAEDWQLEMARQAQNALASPPPEEEPAR